MILRGIGGGFLGKFGGFGGFLGEFWGDYWRNFLAFEREFGRDFRETFLGGLEESWGIFLDQFWVILLFFSQACGHLPFSAPSPGVPRGGCAQHQVGPQNPPNSSQNPQIHPQKIKIPTFTLKNRKCSSEKNLKKNPNFPFFVPSPPSFIPFFLPFPPSFPSIFL